MYEIYQSFINAIFPNKEINSKQNTNPNTNPNTVKDIVEASIDTDMTTIDQLLLDSYDMYLTRVEHAIRDTKRIKIRNYIIVFETITNIDGSEHRIKDIFIFYIDDNGDKNIEYKNIKSGAYQYYGSTIKKFEQLYFEQLIKGGVFDKYGYVSMGNANYDLSANSNIDKLYDEMNKLLKSW
jgi:hypothetical protein